MSKSYLSIDRRKQIKQKKLRLQKQEFLELLNEIKKEGIKYDADETKFIK